MYFFPFFSFIILLWPFKILANIFSFFHLKFWNCGQNHNYLCIKISHTPFFPWAVCSSFKLWSLPKLEGSTQYLNSPSTGQITDTVPGHSPECSNQTNVVCEFLMFIFKMLLLFDSATSIATAFLSTMSTTVPHSFAIKCLSVCIWLSYTILAWSSFTTLGEVSHFDLRDSSPNLEQMLLYTILPWLWHLNCAFLARFLHPAALDCLRGFFVWCAWSQLLHNQYLCAVFQSLLAGIFLNLPCRGCSSQLGSSSSSLSGFCCLRYSQSILSLGDISLMYSLLSV